ncbi:uncharacterized protein BT62DRAFT_304104 [Guyanagaster necrorhizus]|uniref:Uncharacterized protein n=1 Tax=Guyanagaster necrorhizus TaxID=856835 RepID=A0A9P8AQ11_9AGAR|nr:uncharacterized protein BT62DRAFT_304104 [Guyanagaster necrorhizus MCA 3950]KAG7443898.1 hypothetical protein BT62DRAFT_304104 [Guyanagaster necrorhizus MCA 3950]
MNNFFISLLLPISLSFAAGTNRTIDDGLGDVVTGLQVEYLPLYSPNNTAEPFWKHEDQCDGCAIMPDVTKAFDGTWTATTYVPAIEYMSAGLRFNGTAIYIYLILSNYPANTSLVSRTVCDFRLDGSVVGAFDHEMDGTSNFEYNTLAYSNESLSDEEHIFLIETTGSESSYVVFDYAIYTSVVSENTTFNLFLTLRIAPTTILNIPLILERSPVMQSQASSLAC